MGSLFSEEPLHKCTNDLKLNVGEFFTTNDKNYCSYCVANGCINLNNLNTLNTLKNIKQVQCDCMNEHEYF